MKLMRKPISIGAVLALLMGLVAVQPATAQGNSPWIKCPAGGQCARPAPGRWVQSYGAEDPSGSAGAATYAYFESEGLDSVECGPGLMGDPLYGVAKNCKIKQVEAPAGERFARCAREGETCRLGLGRPTTGQKERYKKVRYGAGGKWAYRYMQNDFTCSWIGLGLRIDPAYGVIKACEVSAEAFEATWKRCGGEGAVCDGLSSTRPYLVRYGDETRNQFFVQTVSGDKFACSAGAFGVDPAYGSVKFCSYAEHVDIKDIVGGWKKVASCQGDGKCTFAKELQTGIVQGSALSAEVTNSIEVMVGGDTYGGSVTHGMSTSVGVVASFERSMSETLSVNCEGKSLWQWETGVTRLCDWSNTLCATIARSKDYVCLEDNPASIPKGSLVKAGARR